MTRPASKTQATKVGGARIGTSGERSPARRAAEPTITVLNIGEAGESFPQMVSSLESGSSATYVVGRYGRPAAALVSYQRFAPMLVRGHRHALRRLALVIAKRRHRTRAYGLAVVACQSADQLGLINLGGIVVAPWPGRDWRGRTNGGGTSAGGTDCRGLEVFRARFPGADALLVGAGGTPLETFLGGTA